MNALQTFIAAHSNHGGFLNGKPDVAALAKIDRLCPVLVRCGGCRFTCAAQDFPHMMDCLTAGGDYVRDVSFLIDAMETAATWKPEPERTRGEACHIGNESNVKAFLTKGRERVEGEDWLCTGNFDGFTCGSDADPGL